MRVRFAPSPTGYLHIGGARTALFNWLYARRHGGTFVLRIEDTDTERSSWDMVTGIVDGLRWLGLDWDEGPDVGGPHGPYFQSQRLEKHRAMAEALVGRWTRLLLLLPTRGDPAEARSCGGEGRRMDVRPRVRGADARSNGRRAKRQERRARSASACPPERRDSTTASTARSRSTTPTSRTSSSCAPTGSRPITCRSSPTTSTCEITDVIRGDDHISNTPKHVLLFTAFGQPPPRFAHVPLILGPDKKRLSKRHGATSVMEYHASRLSAGSDGELPLAPRLVAGRRPRDVHARRA